MRSSPLLWALVALTVLLLPLVVLGPQSYITIDDNLDAEVSVPYLLARTNTALDYGAHTVVPQIMNGLPRNALRPGLSLTVACFELLPPLPAYLLNMVLVRLAGLLAMYALLRHWLLPAREQRGMAAAVALVWALLPVYSIYGVSVLGQPAVLLALRELRLNGRAWWPWLVLLLFPLWSSLVLAGVFVLAGAAAYLACADWLQRRLSWRAWLGVGLLALSSAVVEFPLLYSLLSHQFVPHRVEFDLLRLTPTSLTAQVRSTVQLALLGQYHSSLFFRGVMLLTLPLAWWQARRRGRAFPGRLVVGLLGLLLGLAVFGGFYLSFLRGAQEAVSPLRTFNLSRFHFLTPLLWLVVWVLALRTLPAGRGRAVLVAAQLLVVLLMNREWALNLRQLLGQPVATEPNYQQFVAPQLFARVAHSIQRQSGLRPAQYRVACLELPPAVAQLNGFCTLDSYQNNYPLAYKHQFRSVVAGELTKDELLRTYFDAWGNRCYLMAAELGKNFRVGANQHPPLQNFAFDAAAFRGLGGRYVVSAVALARPARSGLQLVGDFADPAAYWHLFVYEVGPICP
ncbi:DUF6044 family protein [Hymenobacter sp. J193]|uniref:DUF6044 family protein n=1 Tax=Hymenobacter sp. J193 TaxID=2898429 RepID=UPI00215074A4|nr:DUF6044 family protein [Hymenobacter sp. J193]MCR5886367.1 DUF6044 family protein [Hymenobacter sp. J193]